MSSMRLPDKILARVAAFSIVGVANTIVGVGVIVLASLIGAGPILANVLGYGAGLVISFTLNSRFTFQRRRVDRFTVMRFLGAFAIAFCVNLAVVIAAKDLLDWHGLLASLAGAPFYVALFYLLCECWVFRHPEL